MNSRIMGPSPLPPAPPLQINLELSCITGQALLQALHDTFGHGTLQQLQFLWTSWLWQGWCHSHNQCCGVTSCVQQHMAAPWTDFSTSHTDSKCRTTEIFNLAAECQALSTELAKQFQTLSRLEAMHCTAAQAMTHETINARQMAQNVAYSVLPDDQMQDKKHEETLQ